MGCTVTEERELTIVRTDSDSEVETDPVVKTGDSQTDAKGNNFDAEIVPKKPLLFVGVGASAGGLEALRDFFDHTSADSDAAFIVVQHLSPDFESLMDELLARNTSMSVENVVHGVEVLANTIYLIPPKKNMTLVDGSLYLSDQIRKGGVNLPIDHFLCSLAKDVRHRAVGIILSGTGSDGSRGIKAIKEAGGLVLVQDRESAKFDGMPFNAAQTGTADFVLPPDELAVYLSTFMNSAIVRHGRSVLRDDDASTESVLSLIFTLLKTHCGIDFSQYKASTVARRIERRMSINQLQSQFDYLNLLQTSKTELENLSRELLINVTSFFRDEDAWKFLAENIIEDLVDNVEAGEELRFWVAACSTGEEAYSLAILIDEALQRVDKNVNIKIFATDADKEAIAHASAARYREEVAHDISAERLTRYFTRIESEFEIRPNIRKMVVFAKHNMISDPPFSNIDLITCRNALIYFQQTVQKNVLSAFHFSLKRNARIFFGSSETVGELKDHYEVLHDRFRVYKKVSNARLPMGSSLGRSTDKTAKIGMRPVSNLLRSYRAHNSQSSRFEHVKDHLINDFVPACLILNSEHQAMHIYGDANKYLIRFPVGKVSTNIHEIIVDELSVALDTALSRTKTESKPVYYSNIQAVINETPTFVNMQVEYFPEKNGDDAYFSVVLSEPDAQLVPKRTSESFDHSEESRQRIRDLENELLHKQEHLQVANEELETTNEELQAANEELMSSNEELQSTNEELQSVNEELYTVNCEHQEKIEELMLVNDDLDNILSATSVGIIFLDDSMNVRKYTSVAAGFFNLLSTDIGRPLHHISNELEYSRLFDDLETVSRSGRSVYREIFTVAGVPMQIKLLPYASSAIKSEGATQGVTITVTDLSPRLDAFEDHRTMLENREHRPGDIEFAGNKSVNMLVVDDSESDRRVINRHLEKVAALSINVFEANSIESAMSVLGEVSIDVCLVDYRLGPDTADVLARSITRHSSRLPLILMSGYSREELKEELPTSTLMYYLNKSELSPLLLELSIRHAINSQSQPVSEFTAV